MKKYCCPYCTERYDRYNLYKHIDKKHDDMLPDNYTAYRMAFDVINDKHGHGNCTICGKPTEWNEKTQKYNRLCGSSKCSNKVKEIYQSRMMRVYNKTHLLDDPKHQEKMLAHRRISGKYKWSDGKIFTYTGQYEKSLMEFLDKIMEFKSNEIIAPGPILEYEYNGKIHHWITDFLLLPYNLIIEVKDGGDNPNTRSMPIYRAKQIAKEEMITNLGKYSYLRLTNNNFSQLMCIMAELKKQIVDDNANNPLYRIHEDYIDSTVLKVQVIEDKLILLQSNDISINESISPISIDNTNYIGTVNESEDKYYALYTVHNKFINDKDKLNKEVDNVIDCIKPIFPNDELIIDKLDEGTVVIGVLLN